MIPYRYLIDINGKLRIDKEKAKTVRLIYNLYLEGLSLNRIAAYLFYEKKGGLFRLLIICYPMRNISTLLFLKSM